MPISFAPLSPGSSLNTCAKDMRLWSCTEMPPEQAASASSLLDLDRHVRQIVESAEQRSIVLRPSLPLRGDRQDGAQMSGSETPQMQIHQSITIGFEHGAHAL